MAVTRMVCTICCRMANMSRRTNNASDQNAIAHFDSVARKHRSSRVDGAVGTNR